MKKIHVLCIARNKSSALYEGLMESGARCLLPLEIYIVLYATLTIPHVYYSATGD